MDSTIYGDPIYIFRFVIIVSNQTESTCFKSGALHTCMSERQVRFQRYIHTDAPSKLISAPVPFPDFQYHVSSIIKPHIVAAFHGSGSLEVSMMASPNFVLDPNSPVMEPLLMEYSNILFGCRFCITCYDKDTITARPLLNNELLQSE